MVKQKIADHQTFWRKANHTLVHIPSGVIDDEFGRLYKEIGRKSPLVKSLEHRQQIKVATIGDIIGIAEIEMRIDGILTCRGIKREVVRISSLIFWQMRHTHHQFCLGSRVFTEHYHILHVAGPYADERRLKTYPEFVGDVVEESRHVGLIDYRYRQFEHIVERLRIVNLECEREIVAFLCACP